jgi:CubicO group peptidase (beta-lactamase class C family)
VKDDLEALLAQGAGAGVYPLARAEVWYEGSHVFSGGNAPIDTAFDLASLTKVLCTTALLLDAKLPLAAPLRTWLPGAAVEATLDDLLFHRSGLPPFLPFFAEALRAEPRLFDENCPDPVRAAARAAVLARVLATPPEAKVRTRCAYSDLGFILLGAALEAATGRPLDQAFTANVAQPLDLKAGFRRLSARLPAGPTLAPTGATRPREPAPGQEGLWTIAERPTRPGEVDDDNAWVMDGVSGHAGLFGTAADVARFGCAVLDGRFAPEEGWGTDPLVSSTRARGFDTPSAEGASCGARFGRSGPLGALGHLGFTGTSLWIDLDRELVVALLTNRVALGRSNVGIRAFRPRFHEAVLDALGLK